jgi:hypothetical protein
MLRINSTRMKPFMPPTSFLMKMRILFITESEKRWKKGLRGGLLF